MERDRAQPEPTWEPEAAATAQDELTNEQLDQVAGGKDLEDKDRMDPFEIQE